MEEQKKIKVAILASGRGSNFIAIADAIDRGDIAAEIAFLFSNKAAAKAVEVAKERGIATKVIESKNCPREEFDGKLLALLKESNIDLVILAGFMKIVGADIIKAFPYKIINIHPSLLPSFKGLHAQRQAIDYGAKLSGCTVHFVDEGVDTGPIILQSTVPILKNDTEEVLSKKILHEEHKIFVEALKLFSEGRLSVDGRKVAIDSNQSD